MGFVSMTTFAARRRMMVDTQVRPSDVTKFPIIEAMLRVPRELYVPESQKEAAYVGENIDLGGGRVVLEPRTLAKILDILEIAPHEVALDIGPAFGYSAAILAQLCDAVVAVEEDPVMAAEAQQTLLAEDINNAAVIEGPLAQGAAKHGPYDIIVVEGAVEMVPQEVLDQLKDGGRIACVFQEGALGVVRIGHMAGGIVSWRFAFNAGAPVLQGFKAHKSFAL
ncbi:MAG: protein-L-isoaspartate(D-aspartate) O-methyltransferase [Paracoccaceae bacterium]|jgi:protein-L-isoaspartate(D-aspartate) O-methyltransferase